MKNLFEPATVRETQARIAHLDPGAVPRWGTMNVAQAAAHCAAGFRMAAGDLRPPRKTMGRLLGWIIKPLALGNDAPMRPNSPTVQEMVMGRDVDLETERARLSALVERFAAAGPAGCTTYPHPFFGRLTPQEWAVLMYKHLDHHLRQFGV